MWIRALRSVLRAPEGESGAGGGGGSGGSDVAAELAATKAALAKLESEKAEASAKAKKAEAEAAKASGEVGKLVEHFEGRIADLTKQLTEVSTAHEGLVKSGRQSKLTEAVAAKLGVQVSPILIGLLPQTGLDIAPEQISDAIVGKVAEAVRKLAPDLKPNRSAAPGPAGGSGQPLDQSDPAYWSQLGKSLAGK